MTTMTEPFGIAQCTKDVVIRVGGLFMTSPTMDAAAESKGLNAGVLCLRGRVGAVAGVDEAMARRLLGWYPRRIVELAWRRSKGLSAASAATEYAGVCAEWGDEHLASVDVAEPVGALAETIVDAADLDDLPLVAGWRAWPRPLAPAARLAHALMLLRELHHGLRLAALQDHDLDPPVALLGPENDTDRLRRLGWPEPDIVVARRTAAATEDLAERCEAAEDATNVAYSTCLRVIDVPAQRTLIDGLARTDQATRLL